VIRELRELRVGKEGNEGALGTEGARETEVGFLRSPMELKEGSNPKKWP
jgi:hypothetical protein